MLIAKILLMIVMFIWSYFGVPPVQIFSNQITGVVKYLLLLQEIGSSLFFFIAVGAVKYLTHCHDCMIPAARKPTMDMPMMPTMRPMAPASKKRVAGRTSKSMEK